MNSLLVFVDDGRPLLVFVPNSNCNQEFNETIIETHSMPGKALKMLLNISGNITAGARFT